MVQVQVEFVEMSHEALTRLLSGAVPKTQDYSVSLRKQVEELVGKNEAKILETQLITGFSGRKTTSESIQELIYPTEYAEPSFPGTYSERGPDIKSSVIPTAFNTRNCGSTLEIEPTISADGKSVNLRLVPELVWHTGNTVWLDTKDTQGNTIKVEMPDFYNLRINTDISCVSSRCLMVAALSPKDGKGIPDMTRKVMVFVKCDILPPE